MTVTLFTGDRQPLLTKHIPESEPGGSYPFRPGPNSNQRMRSARADSHNTTNLSGLARQEADPILSGCELSAPGESPMLPVYDLDPSAVL